MKDRFLVAVPLLCLLGIASACGYWVAESCIPRPQYRAVILKEAPPKSLLTWWEMDDNWLGTFATNGATPSKPNREHLPPIYYLGSERPENIIGWRDGPYWKWGPKAVEDTYIVKWRGAIGMPVSVQIELNGCNLADVQAELDRLEGTHVTIEETPARPMARAQMRVAE